jgi:hypothetical protein
MNPEIKIEDVAIWIKHLHSPKLVERLRSLEPEQEITLETGGVIGRWQRMKTGKDGRETLAIRPVGSMKSVWNDWFKSRKGELIEIREVKMADDYLESSSALFSEWSGDEDEAAFRDL